MQRQRGGLVPIGEAFGVLGGPVKAIRDASPQTRRGFTVADQVHQLVAASEADPDLGFMARTMALCSLPRTNPGNRLLYKGSDQIGVEIQHKRRRRSSPWSAGPASRRTRCPSLMGMKRIWRWTSVSTIWITCQR